MRFDDRIGFYLHWKNKKANYLFQSENENMLNNIYVGVFQKKNRTSSDNNIFKFSGRFEQYHQKVSIKNIINVERYKYTS